MEEKKLNEKESLELIAQMIQNSKKNVRENGGGYTLVWGYVTILVSLLIYTGWVILGQYWIFFGWFLIPVLGKLGNIWLERKHKPVLIKTYLDRVIRYIWLVMGVVCMAVAAAAFLVNLPILFFVGILMGAAITLTGCVTNAKTYTAFGIAGMLLSFLCLLVKGPEQILVFAGVFLVMMVIPGHILNAEIREQGSQKASC